MKSSLLGIGIFRPAIGRTRAAALSVKSYIHIRDRQSTCRDYLAVSIAYTGLCVPRVRVRVRGFTRDTRVLRPLLFFPLPALACITLARFCAHRTVHTPCPVKKKKKKERKKGKKKKEKSTKKYVSVRALLPFRF